MTMQLLLHIDIYVYNFYKLLNDTEQELSWQFVYQIWHIIGGNILIVNFSTD